MLRHCVVSCLNELLRIKKINNGDGGEMEEPFIPFIGQLPCLFCPKSLLFVWYLLDCVTVNKSTTRNNKPIVVIILLVVLTLVVCCSAFNLQLSEIGTFL